MFKPEAMTRLRLVLLERDERAVLSFLGKAGVMQLVRTPAGPETAPLPPRDRQAELARLERLASRLENLRRSFALPKIAETAKGDSVLPHSWPQIANQETVEQQIEAVEIQAGPLLQQRQRAQQRLAELQIVRDQVVDYRDLELPLDARDESAFLHFVTGSLPSKNWPGLQQQSADMVAWLGLGEHGGWQSMVAITTRANRSRLDQVLQMAGFRPGKWPQAAGQTYAAMAAENQREHERTVRELGDLDARFQQAAEKFLMVYAPLEAAIATERTLLEAEQNFPRTENAVFATGWVLSVQAPELIRGLGELTHGCCLVEAMRAEVLDADEIPVLLQQPRWLRPFGQLVAAYGLPRYRELEPTVFVALSYLLMFGMMFGDAGQGLILALIGLSLLLLKRNEIIGRLLLLAGGASMIFGALYGSCFGLEYFKRFALWHDPLAGNPLDLMGAALGIGVALMSVGLILNIINRWRHGDFLGAFLDRFGLAGAIFYWVALALVVNSAALRAQGLLIPAIWLLGGLLLAWLLKEPLQIWRQRAVATDFLTVAMDSLVNVFEGLLSFFANTVSFVRLAAYAMSHAALLLATFVLAENVRHIAVGGPVLAVVVIILGNLIALVLEGIVASVQALRLEYYEFFGKFFTGGGRPFQPFRLPLTAVAIPSP
ncbi:MAG TPA: V-type ATPase 116kDa subunit family protein [Verrucomicrobiae bacterium]